MLRRRSLLGAFLALVLPGRRAAAAPSRLFADPESAAAIGRACLALMPEIVATGATVPAGPVELRRRIAADFAAGRTVEADGWILSLTEARLCAAVALERATS